MKQYLDLLCWAHRGKPYEGRLCFAPKEDPLTKVFVAGHKDTLRSHRSIDDGLVARITLKEVRDPFNVMSMLLQRAARTEGHTAVY